MRFFKLQPEDVIVLHDELDLPFGKVRVKKGGGHAGNNGIRSIDSHIGKEFHRVRLGIGHPGEKSVVTGHVLKDFSKAEREQVDRITDSVARHIGMLIDGDSAGFMNKVVLDIAPPGKPAAPKAEGN
jgi:PTH1 family peptidyl-tRNA hydrolase